jgi:hypothetical protein
MAQIDELKAALVKADAAGNAGDARTLATKIRELQSGDQPAYAMPNPTANMTTGQKFRAGIAAGGLDAGEAMLKTLNDATSWLSENLPGFKLLDQAGNVVGIPSIDKAAPEDAARRAERQAQNAPLLDTTAGHAGSVVGTAGALVPTALIPGAGTYLGSAAIGAGSGAALSDQGERAGGAVVGAVGGVAGKYLGDKLGNVVRYSVGKLKAALGAGQNIDDAAKAAIDDAMRANGMTLADLPQQAQAELHAEVRRALAVGDTVDPAALARKADFAAVGAKPTTGNITRDPQQFAFEQTLKGVNGAGKELADTANSNNAVLIDTLNKAGAAKAPGSVAAGDAMLGAAKQHWEIKNGAATVLWNSAKNDAGRAVQIDAPTFAKTVDDVLKYEMKTDFVPPKIAAMVERFRDGSVPLTVETAEQFKTMLATAVRSSQDGNEKMALGVIRDAIETAPVAKDTGKSAVAAFNQARAATRDLKVNVESIPAVKAALDGAEPDKVFEKMIVNGTVGDVRKIGRILAPHAPSLDAVKAQVVAYFKQKALNGAADEVGNFSQSGYNKALNQFSVNKLEAIGFTADEIKTLLTVGRVSSYIQTAPAGSAVNRSNTAAQGYNLLMKMLSGFSKTPVLGPLSAASGIAEGVGGVAARNALKAPVPITRTARPADLTGRVGTAVGAVTLLDMMKSRQVAK